MTNVVKAIRQRKPFGRIEKLMLKKNARQWLLAALIFIIISVILLSTALTERVDLQVGQVSPKDIQATQRVINRYQTEALKAIESDRAVKEAIADESNYIINDTVAVGAKDRVSGLFSLILDNLIPPETMSSKEESLQPETSSPGESPPTDDSVTIDAGNPESSTATGGDLALHVDGSVGEFDAEPVTKVPVVVEPSKTLTERDLAHLQSEMKHEFDIELPISLIASSMSLSRSRIQELRTITVEFVSQLLTEERVNESNIQPLRSSLYSRLNVADEEQMLSADEIELVVAIAAPTIGPNLVLDLQRVNRLKEAAIRDVKPINVERGQMIVRQFDLVTEEHLQIVKDLGLLKERPNYLSAVGLLLLVLLMMGLFGYYMYQNHGSILKNEGHLALLGLIIVLITGLAKTASVIPFDAAGFFIPVALATMLIGILLDVHVALMASLFLSVIVGMVMGQEFKFALVALTSGMVGAFGVSKIGDRSALTRAGLWVGLAAFVTMLGLGLIRSDNYMVTYSFVGFINGVICAVGTIGLFPYLETLFGITSSIRLLELSNPNQPLLRKLLMEAPGTYHHSMIVGNLAEAAVEAIGGDSLVTRVGAQYHDIGKTKRPYFFIENQYGGDNPHNKIAPSLSTLILTSHVKDGVDLARKYKLPESIIAFIREHHGTTLASFFYHKAKENAKEGNMCDEADFRYPGPKPQSRESAVIMLADSVEAAVRTLHRPTPGRIEGLVRKIVKDRLADGQLDESNVTLRDLDNIAEAFVQVLTGIYHKRIDYPEPENILREVNEKKA